MSITKILFALQDMTPDEIFANKKFAQEIEVSNQAYFPELMPTKSTSHDCSSRIIEIDKLYLGSKKARLEYFKAVKEFYKDKFPLGWDSYLSGGNHYHIFFETREEVESLADAAPSSIWLTDVYRAIRSVPLYAKFKKFDDGTKKFFSRRCWGHWQWSSIWYGSKQSWITAKRTYWSSASSNSKWTVQSLEFRMNWTIDDRLYWLYQAAMIYAFDKTKWEIQPISVDSSIYNGITRMFSVEEMDCREEKCITLDKLHEMWLWAALTESDERALANNTDILLNLLEKYWLQNSKLALMSYINEYNIFS